MLTDSCSLTNLSATAGPRVCVGIPSTASFSYGSTCGKKTRTDLNNCTSEVQTQDWCFSSVTVTWVATSSGGGQVASGTGANASFTAPSPGTYGVTFTATGVATDPDYSTSQSASTTVEVIGPGWWPWQVASHPGFSEAVATPGPPVCAGENSTASFTYTPACGVQTRVDTNNCTSQVQSQQWCFGSFNVWRTATDIDDNTVAEGTGSTASFVAPGPGEYIVYFTVHGAASNPTYHGFRSASTTVEVVVPSANIKEISFIGDHPMYQNSPDHDGWGVGPAINDPVWTNTGTNWPVCYTKGSAISMTVKLDVNGHLPPGQTKTVTLLADGAGNLDATTTFDVTGSNTVGVTIPNLTTTGTLSNMVYNATPTFNWYLICGNGTNSAGSTGPHTIYVTYGTPDQSDKTIDGQAGENKLTVKRIDSLTTAASAKSNLDDVALAVYQWAEGMGNNGNTAAWPSGTPPIWYVWTGISGSCIAHASMTWHALALQGISAETIRVWASSDLDFDSPEYYLNNPDLPLNYDAAGDGSNPNNFEGATYIPANGKYYLGMVTTPTVCTNKQHVLRSVASWEAYRDFITPTNNLANPYRWFDRNGNGVFPPADTNDRVPIP